MNYKYHILYVCFIIFISSVFYVSVTDNIRVRNEILDKIHSDLNMPFIEGTINSPSVEIRCNTFTEFKQKTFELFATTIYYDGGTYYVFNKEMTIAWYYRIEIDAIHSVWENP